MNLKGDSHIEVDGLHRPLWTIDEVADFYRVDRRTVLRWTKTGQIASVKIAKTIRIPAAAILGHSQP
jgi:excisionase family DNA binding protein